jgi:hypothetical protein
VHIRLASILVIALPLAACASNTESARERAVSWSKTVEMAANQWDRGSIPTHYAQHAMGSASDAVHEALGIVRDEAAGQDGQAAGQLDSIAALSAAVDSLAAALAREDKQKALSAAKEVRSAGDRLVSSQ